MTAEPLASELPAQSSRARAHRVVIVFSLLGVLLVLGATARYGIGLSPDSAHYVGTARNLAVGEGFYSFKGRPYTSYPPLYPAALAAFSLVRCDALDGARLLNALVFGLIIYSFGRLLLRNVRSTTLAALGTAVVMHPALFRVSVMAWSEPLSVLLTVLSLMTLAQFLEGARRRDLLLASALAALCFLQRYAGVAVVAAGCVVLTLGTRKAPLLRRVCHACVFGAISAGPVALWLLRNYLLTSMPTGSRDPSRITVWANVRDTLDTATGWILSDTPHWTIRVAALVLAAVALLALGRRAKSGVAGACAARKADLVTMGAFLVTFAAFQIAASSLVSLARIGDWLLAPLLVPIMFFAVVAVDVAAALLPQTCKGARRATAIVTAVFVIWLLYSWTSVLAMGLRAARRGAGGYATAAWVASPTMGWLRQHGEASQVYTNAPDAVYLLAGLRTEFTPPKEQGVDRWKAERGPNEKGCVVWFKQKHRSYLRPIKELVPELGLREVEQFPDGTVYVMP